MHPKWLGAIIAAKDQVWCELHQDAVILNLKTGVYYGLDPVGAFVWKVIQSPTRFENLRDAILREYDVEPAVCERDLCLLLDQLQGAQLIDLGAARPEST